MIKKITQRQNKTKEDIRKKLLKKEIGCEIIRINPNGKGFDIYVEISKIYNYIIKLTQTFLIDKISN